MVLNLVQLLFSYLLTFFIIRECIHIRRRHRDDKRFKWMCFVLMVIGIVAPIVSSAIFISRHL